MVLAAAFPQAGVLLRGMHEILIMVAAPSDIEIDLQAIAASKSDAALLSQLLQAGVLYSSYQSANSKPALTKIPHNCGPLPTATAWICRYL
jgi:hypothetical protein